MFKVISN